MIIESQLLKSKSDLQEAIQKQKIGSATIYRRVKKPNLNEVLSSIKSNKELIVIIIEN